MTRLLDRPTALCYKVPMLFHALRARPPRLRRAALLAAFVAVALSCSSDPDGPMGSDSDLLGTTPGDVFQDTIGVYADTVVAINSMITAGTELGLGMDSTYTRTIILDFSYADVNNDPRAVESAFLHLVPVDATTSTRARFYVLDSGYSEGDTLGSLDTTLVIPDPDTGSSDRLLELAETDFKLPSDLIQAWVRDPDARRAIAVVYTGSANEVAAFKSRHVSDGRPLLKINFDAGSGSVDPKTAKADANAIFVRPRYSTPNLIISDGYVRRMYFRMHLDELPPESAVHTARVRFHIVPGSLIGTNTTAVMYTPLSPDPGDADFKTGQLITDAGVLDGDSYVDFKVTNAVFLTLQGELADNGFVLRMQNENTEVRQIEFYGPTAADSLRPSVFITTSTPAHFDP